MKQPLRNLHDNELAAELLAGYAKDLGYENPADAADAVERLAEAFLAELAVRFGEVAPV